MERRMRGNSHVRCGAGEKLEIISKVYLLLFFENKSEDIARYWYELLFEENMKEYFEKITFSILDREGKTANYESFIKYFK